MAADTLVTLVRAGWLVLTVAMLVSRVVFQVAGPVRMRAFLDAWQEGTPKRLWGAAALAYAVVIAAGAVTVEGSPSWLEWVLLGLLLAVLAADGLVNVLPAGFRTFKDAAQDAWVRRHGPGSARAGDARLFTVGNALLGLAAGAMTAVVIAYEPIAVSTLVASAAIGAGLVAVLVGGRIR